MVIRIILLAVALYAAVYAAASLAAWLRRRRGGLGRFDLRGRDVSDARFRRNRQN